MHKPRVAPAKNVKKQKPESLEDALRIGLRKALPKLVIEISDTLEKRPPRLTKKAKREIEDGMDEYINRSVPLITDLQALEGDRTKLPEAYGKTELLIRTWLTGANIKIKGDDAIDAYLREFQKFVRLPSDARRITHVRRVYEGLQGLIAPLVIDPQKEQAATELLQEFERRHRRQYMRYLHGFEARHRSNRNVGFKRMTSRNISLLSEEYRDGAAALEKRLRLMVGLNYIAQGSPKTYAELRKLSLRNLCDVVASAKNKPLHFLRNVVNPDVRNALAHDGAGPIFSKSLITFVDYSPATGEREISWTMSKFLRNTMRLVQTIMTATYLELLFRYSTADKLIARLRHHVQLVTNSDREPNQFVDTVATPRK